MTPKLDWPLPPEVAEPAPATERRSWGKVAHTERFRQQRRDLMRAAARLASTSGYEGTRVADIVSEAGLSKSTFYEHFSSKEDCFTELRRRTNAQMIREGVAVAERTLEEGPNACMLAVIRSMVGYADRNPRLAMALRSEMGSSQPAIRTQRDRDMRHVIGFFSALARELGSSLQPNELDLVSAILVRGVTDVLGDLRRSPDTLDQQLTHIAAMGCRAFGLDGA